MKTPMIALFCAYVFLFPIGFMTTYLCLGANIVSILRKCGTPKASLDWLQPIIFLDEFSNITYLMSISLAPKNFFIHSPLLISAVLILSVEFQRILNRNPNAPVLSSGMVKDWVAKGSNSKMQE